MSLSSIKRTGRDQTSVRKLRTILASPYKSKYELWDASETENFKQLLLKIIKNSGLSPREFATAHSIHIGLAAVLRSIKNPGISCIFISLKIKPRYVIDLIVKNVQLKNPAAHICALQDLQEFTEKIFGIRALSFTLPLDVFLDPNLRDWMNDRKQPVKSTEVSKSMPDENLVTPKCKSFDLEEKISLASTLGKMVPLEECAKLCVMNYFRENNESTNVELNTNKIRETVTQSGRTIPIKYRDIEIKKIRPNPNRSIKEVNTQKRP